MELYRLKNFLAILREGNLTRAAERLNLSQSALSSQLKQLEEELGVSLFRRTPRGMELSEAGQELLPYINGLLDAAGRLAQKAQALSRDGGEALSIGLNADPGFLRVGAINRQLSLRHDRLNVIFLTSQSVRTAQLLHQGQLDLAFCYGDLTGPGISRQRLAEIRFCVVIPTPLLQGQPPDGWPEAAALPWIWVEQDSPPYQALQHEFDARQLQVKQTVKTVDEQIVKELVAGGQGLALMREDEARPLVAAGLAAIWPKGWLSMPLNLAWLTKHDASRKVKLAREVIRAVWQVDVEPGAAEQPWFYH